MCNRSHSSGLQALSNIAYMSAPHQHRVRLADNKIIFIMLVSSEVWAGGYFATISPDWSLLQNGRWTGYWASLCRVILIKGEENNQQCDRYTWGSRLDAGNVFCLCFAWNNGKEVPRWGVAEIQIQKPGTATRQPITRICCPGVVEPVYLLSRRGEIVKSNLGTSFPLFHAC